jgi:hypothetical protein
VATIYVNKEAYAKAHDNFKELERVAKRECSLGLSGDYINVDTGCKSVIRAVVDWLGEDNVQEIV